MRLKLTLLQGRNTESLPLNANYYISAAIYRTLEQSSAEFAALMHNYGYSNPEDRRKFKLFTFSNLDVPERRLAGAHLVSFSKKNFPHALLTNGRLPATSRYRSFFRWIFLHRQSSFSQR